MHWDQYETDTYSEETRKIRQEKGNKRDNAVLSGRRRGGNGAGAVAFGSNGK